MTHLHVFLFVTCLWHTQLEYRHTLQWVDLVQQPKIGQKIRTSKDGKVWKVKQTKKVCGIVQ